MIVEETQSFWTKPLNLRLDATPLRDTLSSGLELPVADSDNELKPSNLARPGRQTVHVLTH